MINNNQEVESILKYSWEHGSDFIIATLIAVVGFFIITKLKSLLQSALEKKLEILSLNHCCLILFMVYC